MIAWGNSGELPAPLVTSSDLPELPATADNGWTQFQEASQELTLETSDLTMVSYRYKDEQVSAAVRWKDLQESAQGLRAPMSEDHTEALAVWDRASRAPAFADGCNGEVGTACRHFFYFQVHGLATGVCARLALEGEWDEAKDRLANIIRMDRQLLASNRSLMSGMVAASGLVEALPLAHLLEVQHPDPDTPLRAEVELLAADTLLLGFDVKRRAAVGTYLYDYKILQMIREEGVTALTEEWRPALLYDAEHTAALIETPYLVVVRNEANPFSLLSESDDEDLARCSWWPNLRNAIGCEWFDPGPAIAGREMPMTQLNDDLEIAARWVTRLQDSLPPVPTGLPPEIVSGMSAE